MFVCFGGEDWWYHNRGHIDFQMMKRFVSKGTVLYVNSLVMQSPRLGQGGNFFRKLKRKFSSIMRGLVKTEAGFWVYSPISLPFWHLVWVRKLNEWLVRFQVYLVTKRLGMHEYGVWVACPAACDIAIKMNRKMVYQRTDVYELYPGVDFETVKTFDEKLKSSADLTIFVSHILFNKESMQCKSAIYVDHGVDYGLFASAEQDFRLPDDIAAVKKPIVGYFGSINGKNTTDVELIEKVSELLPSMSFVLVGRLESDCAGLLKKQNIHWLGQKLYEKIPHYGKCFDVAIMPWRQNRWIEACNPIKLKEYLALGKPVVSTPFPELQEYCDVVYEARTPEEFSERIKQAISEDCGQRIAARRERVRNETWDSKAELLLEELFGRSREL